MLLVVILVCANLLGDGVAEALRPGTTALISCA